MSEPNEQNSLVPSQTIKANKGKAKKKQNQPSKDPEPAANTANNQGRSNGGKQNNSKRRRNRKKPAAKPDPSGVRADSNAESQSSDDRKPAPQSTKQQQPQKKKNNRRRRKLNTSGKFAWRKQVPEGSMDPITLEPLNKLAYPPFALAGESPYLVIPEWPVPEKGQTISNKSEEEAEKERQQNILQSQWGTKVDGQDETEVVEEKTPRHFNLFDGRALAYYMVSQLQFIDPLNRRDLSRDELVNLDQYLDRHGFGRRVVEAYDEKGVTISSAGAAGNTASGRAAILQQQSQNLLSALFGGTGPANALAEQYAASNTANTNTSRRNRRNNQIHPQPVQDDGIYGDQDGIIVIDDDYNPGLRGGGLRSALSVEAPEFAPAEDWPAVGNPSTASLWTASHVRDHHSQTAQSSRENFPALGSSTSGTSQPKLKGAPASSASSRSLRSISGMVKKTSQKEVLRQHAARENFIRKAQMTNMAFGQAKPTFEPTGLITAPELVNEAPPTEGQLQRNQNMASALGIVPSTVRHTINSGWKRPTDGSLGTDEYGHELIAADYPDALVLEARERMSLVLKMERKWKTFLNDDKAASLPLNRMDRPARKFVHHYSDFWHLNTESFDPEPNRYIHCVKLRDTRAPNPLLSEAARNWTGPKQKVAFSNASPQEEQSAGEAPREDGAKQSPLGPTASGVEAPPGAIFDLESKPNTETEEQIAEARLERPKLNLAPRTRPLELPPMKDGTISMQQARKGFEAERARQARIAEEKEAHRRKLLESAFASDSESEESQWEEAKVVGAFEDEED